MYNEFVVCDLRKEEVYVKASKALRNLPKQEGHSSEVMMEVTKDKLLPSFPEMVHYIQDKVFKRYIIS